MGCARAGARPRVADSCGRSSVLSECRHRYAPAMRGVVARLRPQPAGCYVHPKAEGLSGDDVADSPLDVAEDSAPNYLRWIAALCEPHLGGRVLDVGAGTGAITEQYAEGREVTAIDASEWCVVELRRRFAQVSNVTVQKADLRGLTVDDGFDSVVMINVLEHIQDDVTALRDLATLLSPRGRIVIYVPALNGLYGTFDREVGHFRRYAPWRMREILSAAGSRPLVLRYFNVLALPAWLVCTHTTMGKRPAAGLTLWDRVVLPVNRSIESRIRLPFGLNLFCVAEVDSSDGRA